VVDFERGRTWAKKLSKQVAKYDWRRRRSDMLRELYHQYVTPADRKVFGEFYTPDWLAALMVEAVLDDDWIARLVAAAYSGQPHGVGVLDPACGSGTFLYHAVLRLMASKAMRELQPGQKANVAARLINGIDIHPVAVEITRVNIERALPALPTEGGSALHVYLGDSLQIEESRWDMFERDSTMRLTTPLGRVLKLPMSFVRLPHFNEHFRQMVNAAVQGVRRGGIRRRTTCGVPCAA